MKDDHLESFNLLFNYIYKGNSDAIFISLELLKIAHTWDDIIDGDSYDARDVNKAFVSCIFTIQNSPLWFSCGLNHHVLNCFLRWRDANTIEGDKLSTKSDLLKCYMLRAGLYDIFVIIAYHLFGDEWAEEIGPKVRKYYGETPNEFLEEFKNA